MDKEIRVITVIVYVIIFLIPAALIGIAVYSLTQNVLAAVCLALATFCLCGIFGSGWAIIPRK